MKRFLLKKLCVILMVFFSFTYATSVNNYAVAAGIPVIDGINLPQNVMAAVNSYNSFLEQVAQVAQIKQELEFTIRNTLAPAFWVWDEFKSLEANLQNLKGKIEYFANGGLEDYLKTYINADFYKSSPCFKLGGCNQSEMAELKSEQRKRLEAMRQTSGVVAKGIGGYLDATVARAQQIEMLRGKSKTADGRMEAAGYTNQWLGLVVNSLQELNENIMVFQEQTRAASDVTYDTKTYNQIKMEKNNLMKMNEKVKPFSIQELKVINLR